MLWNSEMTDHTQSDLNCVEWTLEEPQRSNDFGTIIYRSLTLTLLLNPEISYFENSLDHDQLASQKPADHDQHCFPSWF